MSDIHSGPALVTGAARRIGLAIAERLAREGRPVVLHSSARSAGAAESAAEAVEAKRLFHEGEIEKALEVLREGSKKNPRLPPAEIGIARLFLSEGNAAKCRQFLEAAGSKSREHPELYFSWGELALAEGRRTDALVHFEKGASLPAPNGWSPADRDRLRILCYFGRATIEEQRGDWLAASGALAAAAALDPKNTQLMVRQALAAFQLGDLEQASLLLNRRREIDPRAELPDLVLGRFYAGKPDVESAKKHIELAIAAEPADPQARIDLAIVHLLGNRLDDARKQASRAVQLGGAPRELKVLLGVLALQSKDYAEAEKIFRFLAERNPEDADAMNYLVQALAEQESPEKRQQAIRLGEANLRRRPQSADAAAALGWALLRGERAEEANKVLEDAMRRPGIKAETAYIYARVLLAVRGKEAARDAKKLLEAATASSGLFLHRADAAERLAALNKFLAAEAGDLNFP